MADEVVKVDIDRKKIEITAEAQKNKTIKEAEGEGEAIYAKLNGQARGILEVLSKQAEGLEKIVKAAGGDPKSAAMLLVIDKLPELVRTQVDAIKGIKIDKLTVWDSGSNPNGTGSTANFMSNLMKAVPPLNDLFNQAGLNLPEILGKPMIEKKVEQDTIKAV
jgi:flotillin